MMISFVNDLNFFSPTTENAVGDAALKLQSTPDNSNLQGKLKLVRVIGSSSYRELRTNDRKYVKKRCSLYLIHTVYILTKFNCIKGTRLLYKSDRSVT